MKTKIILLLSLILYFFYSCDNPVNEINEDFDDFNSQGEITYIYKDKYYYSTYHFTDSIILYDSKEVNELMDQLKINPNLAMCVHKDNVIEYFDNKEDMEKAFSISNSTRGTLPPHDPFKNTTTAGNLVIYEDSKKKGKSYNYTINSSNNFSFEISDLRTIGFDNKMSSFTFQCEYKYDPQPPLPPDYQWMFPKNICIVTFYEHVDYKGHSIRFYATPECPWREIHYLKSLQMGATSLNWNDRISSFSIGLVNRLGVDGNP